MRRLPIAGMFWAMGKIEATNRYWLPIEVVPNATSMTWASVEELSAAAIVTSLRR